MVPMLILRLQRLFFPTSKLRTIPRPPMLCDTTACSDDEWSWTTRAHLSLSSFWLIVLAPATVVGGVEASKVLSSRVPPEYLVIRKATQWISSLLLQVTIDFFTVESVQTSVDDVICGALIIANSPYSMTISHVVLQAADEPRAMVGDCR